MSFRSSDGVWQTERNLLLLRDEWAKGTSTAEIGRMLGVSKCAIVGKVHRLELDARPSPIFRSGVRQPLTVRKLPPPKLPPLPSEEHALTQAPRPVIATPVPTPNPAPMARFDGRSCCWPIGTPRTPAFRFCDDRAELGKPYCWEHCKLAFQRVGQGETAGQAAHAGGDD